MSAPASQTRIFGIKLGVDPKILAGVLIAFAVVLFWYNSRSDDDTPPANSGHRAAVAELPATAPSVVRPAASNLTRSRRGQASSDRGVLRLRPIDPTRGDVDPTLQLDLLARLQKVELASAGRSLFETGPPPMTPAEKKLLDHPPVVPKPKPMPMAASPIGIAGSTAAQVNIPLKYYGFVKSEARNEANQGLFLDGDDVVLGTEGALVMKRYLVVELKPTSARLEDTQLKKEQTLAVVPAATP